MIKPPRRGRPRKQSRKALMDSYAAGKEALDAKKYDEAVTQLTKAAEVDPKQAAVWSSLADAYMGIARKQKSAESGPTFQKALDSFAKAIELAPTNAGNYNNFALALAESNKVDEAQKNLQKAIELDPSGAGKISLQPRGISDERIEGRCSGRRIQEGNRRRSQLRRVIFLSRFPCWQANPRLIRPVR